MTPQTLADLRSRLPDCDLAVYVDIRSRTVLGADGALRYPQEYLDAVCSAAAQLLVDPAVLNGSDPSHVLVQGPTGCRAFLRVPDEPGEALCCLTGPGADLAALVRTCHAALSAAEPRA